MRFLFRIVFKGKMQFCLAEDIDKLFFCLEVYVEINSGYRNKTTLPMITRREKEPGSPVCNRYSFQHSLKEARGKHNIDNPNTVMNWKDATITF